MDNWRTKAFQGESSMVSSPLMAGKDNDDDDKKDTKPKGGCLGKLLVLILLSGGIFISACIFFITQPQDLSDIGGYEPTDKPAPVRDIKVVLRNALERDYVVTLTETEINQWLGRTLAAKQAGSLGGAVSIKRIYVRLEKDVAEVIIERRIMGKPFTTSMFLRIEQTQDIHGVDTRVHLEGGSYHARMLIDPIVKALPPDWRAALIKKVPLLEVPDAYDASLSRPLVGGRFGRLVIPQGFLILVLPAFEKLPPLFHDEIELGVKRMARVSIEKGKLVMDPREQSGDSIVSPLPH